MSFLRRDNESSLLQRANRYAQAAESTPIRPKAHVTRYLLLDSAVKYMGAYCDSQKGKIDDEKFALLERRLVEFQRKREIEERRQKEYFGKPIDDLLPNKIKHLVRMVAVLGTTLAVGAGVAAYKFIEDTINNYRREDRVVQQYMPELEKDLRGGKVGEARSVLENLIPEKNRLPYDDYKEIWDKVKVLEKEVENSERFVRAKKKFDDAVKAAKEGRYAVALDLVEGRSGINVLLGALGEENLPLYLRDEVAKFSAEVTEFSETYSNRKSSFNVFNPIKEDLNKLEVKTAELSEVLKKGELPQHGKLDNLLAVIDQYLHDLSNKVRIEDVGVDDLGNVKDKLIQLKESVEGRNGLLTGYEIIEFTKLKSSLENFKNKLNKLAMDYLEPDSETTKLNELLNNIKVGLREIDTTRIDIFEFVGELNNISIKLNEAHNQLENISKLKENAKSSDLETKIKASSELAERYFNRDYKGKKWDKVLEYLSLIPEPRPETVEHIGEIITNEEKLMKQEGKILVTAQGLIESDLVGYNLTIESFKEKKITKELEWGVKNLLKRADLEEGKTVLKLINELNLLKLDLGVTADNEKALEINKKIIEVESKLSEGLDKFGTGAKGLLEKGDSIEDPTLLEILAMHYSKVGKKDIAREYENKKDELKKKYGLE